MNEELLKELLATAKAMDAPAVEPSPRAKESFAAMLAKYAPTVLKDAQMQVVILKVLTQGRADGGEIISKLDELKVRHELQGEGVVYALLARMEEEGLISGRFDTAMTRKEYWIQDPGTKLLEKQSDAVRNVSGLVAALWAS